MIKPKTLLLIGKLVLCNSGLLLTTSCYANCWALAEKNFNIDARLLYAIAQVESGMDPTRTGYNPDGSYDIGLMQINSRHRVALQKAGISEAMLKEDPCISILTGASILADMIHIYGYSWEAVGAYNAGIGETRHHYRMKYANRVWLYYQYLLHPPR